MVADGENVDPVAKKIIRQVEYYFGDFNLPRDKFLLEETKSDDGWVTMETMLKFKRLAELSKDEKVIVEALKQSKAVCWRFQRTGPRSGATLPFPSPRTQRSPGNCWKPGLHMQRVSTRRLQQWMS